MIIAAIRVLYFSEILFLNLLLTNTIIDRQGHLSTVILLTKHGADPMVYDGEGFQSLHLAAQFGHTAVVAYLLAHGVPVNSQDMQGMTPLMWAAFRTTT